MIVYREWQKFHGDREMHCIKIAEIKRRKSGKCKITFAEIYNKFGSVLIQFNIRTGTQLRFFKVTFCMYDALGLTIYIWQ